MVPLSPLHSEYMQEVQAPPQTQEPSESDRLESLLRLAAIRVKQRKEATRKLEEIARSFSAFLPYWQFTNRETGQTNSFSTLWSGQQLFLDAMLIHPKIIALKAGKLGFTELETAFDAWRLLFGPSGTRVHIFSRDQLAAREVLQMVKFGIARLPHWMQARVLVDEAGGNTTESLKVMMPTDPEGGRPRHLQTYSAGAQVSIDQSCIHAHVDELARMPFAQLTWEAVASTVSPIDGTVHIVSRGAGEDNILTTLWYAATAGESDLHPVFAPYDARPGRDGDWAMRERANFTATGWRYFAPETPEDALRGDDEQEYLSPQAFDQCYDPTIPSLDHARTSKTPLVLAVDAAAGTVGGDHFAVVVSSRHHVYGDEVSIRHYMLWKPDIDGFIPFQEIERYLRQFVVDFNVVCVAFDPYQMKDMMQRLQTYEGPHYLGVETYEFNQGATRLVSDRRQYDLFTQRRVHHPYLPSPDNELRAHLTSNAKAKVTHDDQAMRIVKRAPNMKIDLAVASSMAIHECLRRII